MTSFEDLFHERGIEVPTLIQDGEYHSCDLDRPGGKGKASYKLSMDGGYGRVINWTDGEPYSYWYASSDATRNNRKYEKERKRDNELARKQRERKIQEGKELARKLWEEAEEALNNPYLTMKNVSSYGLKQITLEGEQQLLVPLFSADNELCGLQKIPNDGKEKKYTLGTSKGGKFFTIGESITDRICICEGYATGASIFEATGYTTIVAFDCGNLNAVSLTIRKRYPEKTIIVCGDNDYKNEKNPGKERATEAAKLINGWLALCPLIEGTDFNDLHKEQGLEAVTLAIESAAPIEAKTDGKLKRIEFHELMGMDIKAQEWILPWMPTQSLNMIHARAGIGKTHVALNILYAICAGGEFLGWKATKPRRCLYIDGEMPMTTIHERLFKIAESYGEEDKLLDGMLYVVTPDAQDVAMPDLASPEGQAEYDALGKDCEVIIVDNLSCLVKGTGSENDAESWLPIQSWALKQRKEGRSIIFIHHSGKGGNQRGTSKKEDILDNIIRLDKPKELEDEEGAVFELRFEKHRHSTGEIIRPFRAQLLQEGDRQVWEYQSLKEFNFDRVCELAQEKLTQTLIAQQLELNQSTVSRLIKKGKELGKISHAYSGAYPSRKRKNWGSEEQ